MFRDPGAVLALLVLCAAIAWTMVLLTQPVKEARRVKATNPPAWMRTQ